MATASYMLLTIILLTVAFSGNLAPLQATQQKELSQIFRLKEVFGVDHPNQIIDFDFAQNVDWNLTYMIGPDGVEVPYQVLHQDKIAIQSDLPAHAERTWKLYAGRAPAPVMGGVKVTTRESYYEITSQLTGVRIPLPAQSLKYTPAPVQGIRARNGQWIATGPNSLSPPAKSMSVRFLESGPLKTIIEVSYAYDRPEYLHKGPETSPQGLRYPAGEGYYKSTIEVQAGQPSILFEEDTDMDVSYSLNIYDGLHPNQARYRGHHSTSKETGYEADGQQYRMWHERPAMDAVVDLIYDTPRHYRPMAVWDPWIFDSGWYWQLYDSHAPANANLFSIFAGRASRAIGAAHSGVSIFTEPHGGRPAEQAVGLIRQPADTEVRAAGITIACNRRGPDGRYFPRVRFAWGLFTGVKGEDLKDPYQVQPIARQMNLHSGINLNKVQRYMLSFPDPTHGYGALYMDGRAVKKMIKKLRQDRDGPHGGGYYGYLYNAEPTSRDLLDMWANPSGEKTGKVASEVAEMARDLLNALVNGDGIYDFRFHYWQGGLEMLRKGVWIDSLLGNDLTSPKDRRRVKRAAVLFANILWDDDFVPLFSEHGLNLGTENMPVQYQGYRNFYAILLAEHPTMRGRAKAVEQQTIDTLDGIVNEYGAAIGSTHYIEASFAPTLNSLMQLRMLGHIDPFKREDRLARFAEFYLNLLTPPEVRFGGTRKLISVGDSSSESSAMYGQLATGFSTARPELSARLMGAWRAAGKPHSGFFGSTVLMIDEDAPASDPALGNATFPGWYSVLRHGWGTRNETAVWVVNGDFYRDHRHHDHGSVVIYALGAPLSIDWGSMYSPHVPGGFMHNMVLPASAIGHPWDRDDPSLDDGDAWQGSTQEAFVSFNTSAYAQSRFTAGKGTVWRRSIYSFHPNEDYPIILIRDSFTGPDAEASKIFPLNMMAEGEVHTPAGTMSPPLRTYQHDSQLPSAGKVFSLRPGLNRLGFTGQWLINWDLYTISSQLQEAHIGNWAHSWHPSREQSEFAQANGRAFEERQHLLRLKGSGPFQVLILPYRKGESQDGVQVTHDGSNVSITAKGETTIVGETFYAYMNPHRRVLATFNEELAEANSISAAGGPVEILVAPQQATITAHGRKGIRRIQLPGKWNVKDPKGLNVPLTFEAGGWILDYQGKSPVSVTLEKR